MNAVLVRIITWTNNENILSERSQFMQIHILYNFIHMKMQNREIEKKVDYLLLASSVPSVMCDVLRPHGL